MSFHFQIPKPCSENWSTMTEVEKGKLCEVCNRKVHDLITLNDFEIIDLLKSEEKICGRIKKEPTTNYRYTFKKYGIALSLASIFSFTSQIYSKPNLSQISQTEIFSNRIQNDTIVIKGNVTESKMPLPGATVLLKGTKIHTQTDIEGNFTIEIPQKFMNKKITLIFSFIGTISKEVKIKNPKKKLNIELESDTYILGEVVEKKSFLRSLFS